MSNTPKTPAAAEELKAPTPGPAERDALSDAALDDVAGGKTMPVRMEPGAPTRRRTGRQHA